jgi:hypothetical protein
VTQTLRQWSAWCRVALAFHVARMVRASATGLALFALLGVGHVLPAFHFALVAHRVCAEHGELVHESATAVEPSTPTSDVALVAGEAASHEHEHCGVLALPGSFALPASPAAPFDFVSGEDAIDAPGRALAAHVGIDLLSLAPKLPPPA